MLSNFDATKYKPKVIKHVQNANLSVGCHFLYILDCSFCVALPIFMLSDFDGNKYKPYIIKYVQNANIFIVYQFSVII